MARGARHSLGHGSWPGGRLLPVLTAVFVTLLVDNWLRGALHLWHFQEQAGMPGGVDPRAERVPLRGLEEDPSSSPGWALPDKYKAQASIFEIVAAIPLAQGGQAWVRTSRVWRRGIRAAFVTDFVADVGLRLEGGEHGEEFPLLNTTDLPFHYYGKAAMAPSVAHAHFGEYNYKWMLYGDDDTVWFMDTVIGIIDGLDPDMPHLITDHFWFWGATEGSPKHPVHPAWDAPRCVPCGFNMSRLAGKKLPFQPPEACPYCTWQKLCQADSARRELYTEDCSFKPRYPPESELLAHGGGGIILSVGLMRLMSPDYMRECIGTKFKPDQVFGGDTMFSHCAFFQGVAPTDPGHFFLDPEYNAFDQGGQLIQNNMNLLYAYLKRGCCDARCAARLDAAASMHMRAAHFKEPAAAMDTARLLLRLREVYLAVRKRAAEPGVAEAHAQLTPSWDNHKVCY